MDSHLQPLNLRGAFGHGTFSQPSSTCRAVIGTVKRLTGLLATVALATVLLVPTATAQTEDDVVPTLQAWQDRLRVGEPHEATLIIDYNCAKADPQGTQAEINVTAPPWATVSGTDSVTLTHEADACLENGGRATHPVAYQIEVARTAPALVAENVTFNVTVSYTEGDANGNVTEALSAAFLADIAVDVEPRRVEAFAGRTAEHNLTVTNRGNGPIAITISVSEIDDGLELQVPASGQAPSPLEDEDPVWRGTITATGRLPTGVNSGTFNATIDLTASHAEEAGQGSTKRQINLTAAIERHPSEIDEGGPIPGFEVASILVAAAVVALARHRREA